MFWNRVLSINLYLAWENFIFPTKFSTKKFNSKYHLTCALELFSINLIPCITSFNVIFAINSWYYIRINILNLYLYNCALPKWIDVEFPHIAVKILGFVSRILQIILNLKEKYSYMYKETHLLVNLTIKVWIPLFNTYIIKSYSSSDLFEKPMTMSKWQILIIFYFY